MVSRASFQSHYLKNIFYERFKAKIDLLNCYVIVNMYFQGEMFNILQILKK
jgi:hypothetical protein